MTELDPDVRAFLERTRNTGVPSASERERVRSRLLAAGAATTVAAGAPTAAALTSSVTTKILLAVVLASVAIGAPAAYSALTDSAPRDRTRMSPPASVGSTDRSDSAQEARAPEPLAVPSEPPSAAPIGPRVRPVATPAVTRAAARPATSTPRVRSHPRVETATTEAERAETPSDGIDEAHEPSVVEDTLAEEISLLARSVRALNEGSFDEARALLDEHTSRFPDSQLRREREATAQRLEAEAR